jgi:pimeloyl-ACP methyl ester carboxylesterase
MENALSYTTEYVTSKDGTIISYRQLGHGDGIILIHGALQAAQNFMQLANALANDFTVYILTRRGRGQSGPFGDNYSLAKDLEDVAALITKTNAHNVFGLSSGAIISLHATLTNPAIHKLAIYEPPLSGKRASLVNTFATKYEKELAGGNLAAAFVTLIKGMKVSKVFSLLPRFLLVPMVKSLIKKNAATKPADDVSLAELIPTWRYDNLLVLETVGPLEKFKEMQTDTLLLSGSNSPAYLKNVVNGLNSVLPHARHIEFKGLDHMGADNTGKPAIVAEELKTFFYTRKK